MLASDKISQGDLVATRGYRSANDDGQNQYKIIKAGTGEADGGAFINLNNGLQAEGLFPGDEYRLEQFGAIADGKADDVTPWRKLMAIVPSGKTVRFVSGKTYLVSAGCNIENEYLKQSDMPVRSFNIVATGATIRLREFTGSELLQISHNPSGNQDRWKYTPWSFTWTGGTVDANGYRQHDKFAVWYRDGNGQLKGSLKGDPHAEAMQASTALAFGPGGRFEIDPQVKGGRKIEGEYANWLFRIQGAQEVTVENLTTQHRIRDGFVVKDAASFVVRNCRDENSLPTNDQYSITIKNGGGAGNQHFAWNSSKSRTSGILELNLNGLPGLQPGDEIIGDQSGLHAFVSSIQGNQVKVYHVYGRDKNWTTGETFNVNGKPTKATIKGFEIHVAPEMLVENCVADVGCSGVGFMATREQPRFTTLTVRDSTFRNMGTAGIRNERATNLIIENCTFENDHILADPTGQVNYPSQQGINIANATEFFSVKNCNLRNMQIDGGNGSYMFGGLLENVNIIVDDLDPIKTTKTGTAASITGIELQVGEFRNCTVRSTGKTKDGAYPISIGIEANSAWIDHCLIDGAELAGISKSEKITNTVIRNVNGAAIADTMVSTNNSALIENVTIENAEIGFTPQSANRMSAGSSIDMKNVKMSNLQSNCVAVSKEINTLNVKDCVFTDFGLDDTLEPNDRAAFGGNRGYAGIILNLEDVTFAANATKASTIKVATNRITNEAVNEKNTVELPRGQKFTNLELR